MRPSLCVLVGESDDDAYYAEWISGTTYLFGDRHNKTGNAGYIDGHAETLLSKDWNYPDVIPGAMREDGVAIRRSTATASYNWTNLGTRLNYFWGTTVWDASKGY